MGEFGEQDVDEVIEKLPYKRIKFAVNQVVECAIPIHLQLLKTHRENIKQFENLEDWASVHAEQVKASNTIRLLKSDLYELRSLSSKLRDEDIELFQDKTKPVTDGTLDALAEFLELYPHVMSTQAKNPDGSSITSFNQEFPSLVCNSYDTEASSSTQYLTLDGNTEHIQAIEAVNVQKRWYKLQKELAELSDLFRKFAGIVFSQKDKVDHIEDYVQHAQVNVQEGSKHLGKAVILQSAAFPATGAVIGGFLLGPVGAVAGFKIFGTVACALSGCALGYGVGRKIKQKRQLACDMEMKALTYSSKSLSLSTPDIVQLPDEVISKQLKTRHEDNNSE